MRVSEHVHFLLHRFEIKMPTGAKISRFVPSFVIDAEKMTIVDSGVKASADEIFACVESLGSLF